MKARFNSGRVAEAGKSEINYSVFSFKSHCQLSGRVVFRAEAEYLSNDLQGCICKLVISLN